MRARHAVNHSDSLQRRQSELVGQVGGVHGVGQILDRQTRYDQSLCSVPSSTLTQATNLLVGKDEQEGIPQLILAQHSLDYPHRHNPCQRYAKLGLFNTWQHSRSSLASATRSLSFESTTKMIPWVFWKSVHRRTGARQMSVPSMLVVAGVARGK